MSGEAPPPARATRLNWKLLVVLVVGIIVVAGVLDAVLGRVTAPSKKVTASAAEVLLTPSEVPEASSYTLVGNNSIPQWSGPGTSRASVLLRGNWATPSPMDVNLTLFVALDAGLAEAQYNSIVVATPYETYDLGVVGADAGSYFEAFNFSSGGISGTSSRGLEVLRYNVVFYFYFDSDATALCLSTLQAWALAQLTRIETFAH